MAMIKKTILLLTFIFVTGVLLFAENKLSIIHTNDLHSHILGFSPNSDYSPDSLNDDSTRGGWARISTAMKNIRASRDNPVITVDAGDFTMGTLFHTINRENALELLLLDKMGVDVTTLGNHEFDFRPRGVAQTLESARKHGAYPVIVSSNPVFSSESADDDELEELFKDGMVREYYVQEKDGLKIGYFGLIGTDAVSVTPFMAPLTFTDPIETAKKVVKILKEEEKVDVVICLSHSGLTDNPKTSEDQNLAKAVPDIDVIISAHTHTILPEPLIEGNTIIVQSGQYGRQIGLIDLIIADDGQVLLDQYKLVAIDDSIPGDPELSKYIEEGLEKINSHFLADFNLKWDTVIAETAFDLQLEGNECSLGNLIADSIRWSVDQAQMGLPDYVPVNMAIQSNGMIRDSILTGETGKITVADLFRSQPLGTGVIEKQTIGYPILLVYVTAEEVKKALEMITTIVPMKSDDYALQLSGVQFEYNSKRMLFDRVTSIKLINQAGEYEDLDYSASNKKLYSIATNTFNAFYLKVVGDFTAGILDITLKDRQGNKVEDLSSQIVDGDRNTLGIQEIKEWAGMAAYMQSFADTDGNGISDMPERYRETEGRQVNKPSLNPVKLLKNGNSLTLAAFAAIVLVLAILFFAVFIPVRIVKKRKANRVIT